jgi:PKHD-type hydroxylase
MIVHIPQVLDGERVLHMRQRLRQAHWTDGRQTVGAQGAQVKRNQQLAEDSPLRAQLGREVLAALAQQPLFHAAALPVRILPPRFNRYRDGGQYGFHVDGAVMQLPAAPGQPTQQMRSDVSCTLFLNDPDSYDGGELIIADTYGEHEVKLAAGDLVVYPSSSLHRVAPVTRGERLAAFFWVQSLIRDDARRQLLLELDSSIQALTAGGADRGSVLRLTGIYHNLLRQWSET